MFQEDWFMRQIESLVQMVARFVFHKDAIHYTIVDETALSGTDLLFRDVMALLQQGKINEAENLLFERMNPERLPDLEVAVDFYQRLGQMGDRELEAGGFTREEIKSGLDDAIRLFDISF